MSTAAAQRSSYTDPNNPLGVVATVKAFNALTEHQALLTPAELRLALCVVRAGGHRPGDGVTVSDQKWQAWTGLDPRSKEMAMKGLQKKCFDVEGRGNGARFHFRPDSWEQFVYSADRPVAKPRTEGRKVDPKPGAKVHPECRERGCALLARDGLSAENAKPVSQTAPGSCEGSKTLTLVPAIQNAKRVSQTAALRTVDAAELVWAKTLAALQSIYPLITVVFLVRLMALVRVVFPDVTDQECASAVKLAWREHHKKQKSEGLFLMTVPEAIGALRKLPKPAPASGFTSGVQTLLARVAEVLRARGAPFAGHLAEVELLRAELLEGRIDPFAAEPRMEQIERMLVDTAGGLLSPEQRAAVDTAIAAARERHNWNALTPAGRDSLDSTVRRSATLDAFGIPRVGSFYA